MVKLSYAATIQGGEERKPSGFKTSFRLYPLLIFLHGVLRKEYRFSIHAVN